MIIIFPAKESQFILQHTLALQQRRSAAELKPGVTRSETPGTRK